MNPETLKAMKEAAEKATPGSWSWTYHPERRDSVIALESDSEDVDVLLCTGDSYGAAWGDISEADADFIEWASPANVSALIAEVERLRGERNDFKRRV